MRIPCTSKCNCYIVYCRRPRETWTYRRRQLFSSTCRIQTRIRNKICARWEKKFYAREQSFLKRRAVSISILGRHLWHTQPSQLREQRTWPFARTYTCNTFLASRLELNITHICGIYVNANVIAVHAPHRHCARALAACEKPTEHTIFQRENAGCIPPRVDNA